jgi:putative flippase GtrA
MNTIIRWGKFNVVGAMGMVAQLSMLSLFNYWFRGHYLYASMAAIELTLLHNFIWHSNYTWKDRHNIYSRSRRLLRFHLSNGMVSMFGNLVLMRLLIHSAHLPVLASDAIAILCCSIGNFFLGDTWAFAGHTKNAPQKLNLQDQHVCKFSTNHPPPILTSTG